jgi:RHS repeat-associated protein
MSPVEAASGNFIYSLGVLRISGLGPALDITLTYNSQDLRRGPFGVGWVNPYEQRIIETTDGTNSFAINSHADGKRERFQKNLDGTYTPPPHVFETLTKNLDGTFALRDKYGMVRRFSAQGLLAAIVDRNGNALSLTYDATGFMTQIKDASGRSVSLTKGADGRVESITDPAGRAFRFGYDTSGNLTSYTDPLLNVATYQYDSANNLTAVIDPRGNTLMRITYDSTGRVAQHVDGAETWTYSYSPSSKRTTKRDSQNNTWTFDYNDNGNVTKITDPFGKTEQYIVDTNLNVTQFTNKNGNTTKYTYDSVGNQLTVTDALNNVRTMTYEPVFNRPLTLQDALGNKTRFEYDSHGNLSKSIDALGHITQFQYDIKGELTRVTDALGNSSTFTYDSNGNLTQAADPLGNTNTATYDALGKVLTAADAEGRSTQFVYDDNERLIRSINASGGTTINEYDASNNLIAITVPSGAKTTFQYDTLQRIVKTTNPLGQSTNYTYDRRDNLASRVDAKGQTINYAYDALDRLTFKTKPEETVSYNYDAMGNLLNIADSDSNLSFVYDAMNRLTEARTAATSGQPATTIRATYDANGNRKTMTDLSGEVTNYVYDTLQRLTSITDPTGQQFTFTYDALSRRTRVDRPIGLNTIYTYDIASRLTSLVHQGGPGNLSFIYTYDRIGNRLTKTDAAGLHSYAYDSLYRLMADSLPAGSPESYSYDPVDNRTMSHISASYSHNAANRLTEDATFDYLYDANGDLTRRTERATGKVTNYTYDSENRIVRIDLPDSTSATYRYDGLGRRIEKNVSGQITQYIYDGEDILLEYTGTTLTARYTHGPDTDEVLSAMRGGTISYFQADVLNSVTRVLDAGSVKASYTYDSFGRIASQSGAREAPYAFQGRESDQESGLYYFRARYYDPQVGRFISEDPIGFRGGNNLYSFVRNNPIILTDPSGLYPFEDIIEFIPDAIGADLDFIRNYRDMRAANTIGADKYFHCKANCEAAKRGPGGALESYLVGEGRELTDRYIKGDPASACDADRRANDQGRKSGRNNRNVNCSKACANFRPKGLNPKY